MPDEPLALQDLLAGLPDKAGYDTVYAAVMATERGRRFLAEYAKRNRNANTDMLVGAIARVEAAIRGEPAAQSSADLEEIVAAIDRIEAVLAASMASDVHSAVEQIQDIAFVLHERPVEQSLCDALDGAIREIADVLVRPDGTAASVRVAAEMLRALAAQIRLMIAPSANQTSATAAAAADRENFAEAIATLATSLPSLADAAEPEAAIAGESRMDGEGQHDLQSIDAEPTDTVPIEPPVAPHDAAEGVSEELQNTLPPSENVLLRAFESNPFSRDETPSRNGREEQRAEEPGHDIASRDGSGKGPPGANMLATRGFSPEPVVSPEEDPGDLFEPMPVPTPLPASAIAAAEPPVQTPAQRLAATPRAISRPPASDPLAAVRALSAEELIALFS